MAPTLLHPCSTASRDVSAQHTWMSGNGVGLAFLYIPEVPTVLWGLKKIRQAHTGQGLGSTRVPFTYAPLLTHGVFPSLSYTWPIYTEPTLGVCRPWGISACLGPGRVGEGVASSWSTKSVVCGSCAEWCRPQCVPKGLSTGPVWHSP